MTLGQDLRTIIDNLGVTYEEGTVIEDIKTDITDKIGNGDYPVIIAINTSELNIRNNAIKLLNWLEEEELTLEYVSAGQYRVMPKPTEEEVALNADSPLNNGNIFS